LLTAASFDVPREGLIVPRVSSPEERSSSARAREPIELKVEYERLNSFFADYTKNISRGGTFVRTERPLDIGTEFVFKLGVPTLDEPLVLSGKVQWVVREGDGHGGPGNRDPGMGIGFVFQTDAEREQLHHKVEQLMREELGPALAEKLLARGAG
jgi:type IV pilus assembly protein PilZ